MDFKALMIFDLLKGCNVLSDKTFDNPKLLVRQINVKNGKFYTEIKVRNQLIGDKDCVLTRKADDKYQIVCSDTSDFYLLVFPYLVS